MLCDVGETAVKIVMYIEHLQKCILQIARLARRLFPFQSPIRHQKNTLHTTPLRSPKRTHAHLRIVLLLLAKRIRQPTTNHVRNTKTNSRAPHQPSHAKLATETLLPPSRKNQVCRAPGGCQAGAVGLEAVDVEVGAEEEDGREEHGQCLERAHVLGDHEGCEEG